MATRTTISALNTLAMVAVRVINREDDTLLTFVREGDTVATARGRIELKLKSDLGDIGSNASFFVLLEDVEGIPCLDTESISADKAPYKCRFSQQLLQGQGQKKRFCVTGTIERSVASAGDRFQVIQLARGGYYRPNEGIEQGFQCLAHPEENRDNLRLISVGVVFEEKAQANSFAAAVHSYVAKTPGVHLHQGQIFQISTMDPFEPERLVLETDYVPREKDGEAPLDSPVLAVEINSMDQSAVISYYSRENTVYKYQRIEAASAFARSIPEGAHIFPAALCHGQYKWLDKQEFNRLALSGPGHQQFDGTARGNSKRAKTSPMVAVQPIDSGTELLEGVRFMKISIRLWCRNANVADAWRPFLHNHVTQHNERGMPYYEGLGIYCEEGRRQVLLFELEEDPNGITRHVCVTAIPGIDDPTTMSSWNRDDKTVAVSEIMYCLLQWSYTNTTTHVWTAANQVGR